MFVDRERELAFLQQTWNSGRAELVVVYGRRRVGKTALLRTFSQQHPHTFWVASLSSEAILRQSFTDALWQTNHPAQPSAGFIYESWERAFGALADLAASQRHCVVIDEFPYLAGSEPSVPSVLQKVWDERLQHTNVMLVLCGSHIGMMERQTLDYQAPLYGRRTGQMQLHPLPLHASAGLLPLHDPVDQIETYAVLGGIATYWSQFDAQSSLLANIEQRILNPASYLYQEPLFLLREELQEPRNYFAILQAIAQGLPTVLTDAHGHEAFADLGYRVSAEMEKAGYDEIDYQESDEHIAELLEANEFNDYYRFNRKGEHIG